MKYFTHSCKLKIYETDENLQENVPPPHSPKRHLQKHVQTERSSLNTLAWRPMGDGRKRFEEWREGGINDDNNP